jgi:hypothetical protein
MSVDLDDLPPAARDACMRLRDGLTSLVGRDLVALWVYGAATFPERPARLGDVDTHGVLARRPDQDTSIAIDRLHETIADESGVEWDSWYILESDARKVEPPRQLLRADLADDAWALHRAHWLAGQVVELFGLSPSELVAAPSWPELEEGLHEELLYIEELIERGRDDAGHAAFMIWNACRIIYSLETRDVVVSKRASARWALDHLPDSWHAAIRAAGRVYDDQADDEDATVLQEHLTEIISATRDRFSGS